MVKYKLYIKPALYRVLKPINKPCSAAKYRVFNLFIDSVYVQRLADCVGGVSLNVKPQAYGGRKIPTLVIEGYK